jgi:hypothetical protein
MQLHSRAGEKVATALSFDSGRNTTMHRTPCTDHHSCCPFNRSIACLVFTKCAINLNLLLLLPFQLEPYMDEAFLNTAMSILGQEGVVSIKVT